MSVDWDDERELLAAFWALCCIFGVPLLVVLMVVVLMVVVLIVLEFM